MEPVPLEVSCQACQALLAGEHAPPLIDCREENEHEHVAIAGSTLVPMSQITTRIAELEPLREKPFVVYCHHGMRSAQVVNWLRGQGFAGAQSMAGGIDQWSLEIDPALPRY